MICTLRNSYFDKFFVWQLSNFVDHSTVGQEPGNYFHRPSSGLEKGSPSIPDFYRPDELKYHGKRNRGVVTMNFYDEIKRSIGDNAGATLDFCGGEWKYPRYEFDF